MPKLGVGTTNEHGEITHDLYEFALPTGSPAEITLEYVPYEEIADFGNPQYRTVRRGGVETSSFQVARTKTYVFVTSWDVGSVPTMVGLGYNMETTGFPTNAERQVVASDDPLPTASMFTNRASVTEGDPISLRVTMSEASSELLFVSYTKSDGTGALLGAAPYSSWRT